MQIHGRLCLDRAADISTRLGVRQATCTCRGCSDTHFLIAPTVAAIDVRKGPQAQRGFGTGTAAELALTALDRVPGKGVYVALRSGSGPAVV